MMIAALRHSRPFRFASLLALWAMLLPALLPLMHPMAAMATAGGNATPICHMVMGGGDHKPAAPQDGKSQPSCPLCQSLGSLAQGFTPPDIVGFVAVHPVADTVHIRHQTLTVFEASLSARPRAPPSLA